MSNPRQIYEKLTNSFWIPTKQPPREQLAFSAAWDYQQLIIDQLRAEKSELIEALDTVTLIVGLTAFKYAAQRDVLQEAVDNARKLIPKP